MLYFVTLTYRRPLDEVNLHLATHKAWLARHLQEGRIVFAGPLEEGTGGVILARCDSRDELDRMLAADSFVTQAVVDSRVQAFKAALKLPEWPAQWA
jgi:uncharacterized protein YciI